MAVARFLESNVIGPSGFWTKAPLRYAAKLNLQSCYRAVIKFHFGPLVVNLDTSSMYFLCKILNSMVFGLMTKLLQSVKIFETGLNVFARPNIIELENLQRAGI